MLDGGDFGSAVRAARRTTYRHESNTWGAYQCYGDPGFRLLMDVGVRRRVTGAAYPAGSFLDSTELVIELGNLQSRARVQKSDKEKDWIVASRDEQHVEDGLPPRLDVPRCGPHHLRAARGGGCECERMVW